MVTLIVAGHETVASALTWAWWLVAGHRVVADRLAAESVAVLGGRRPTLADVARLPVRPPGARRDLAAVPAGVGTDSARPRRRRPGGRIHSGGCAGDHVDVRPAPEPDGLGPARRLRPGPVRAAGVGHTGRVGSWRAARLPAVRGRAADVRRPGARAGRGRARARRSPAGTGSSARRDRWCARTPW